MSNEKVRAHSCCHQKSTDNQTFKDPVCGMNIADNKEQSYNYKGNVYYFCSSHCTKSFKSNPDKFLNANDTQQFREKPAALIGIVGALLLIVLFFTIVILASGTLENAWQEFTRLWYWVLILAAGFGLQLGLFFHIRNSANGAVSEGKAEVAASGTISTGSMIACCTHGLVNLLPILGASAAAAFLAQYQLPLILLGVFSNLTGLTIMLGIMQKHNILPENTVAKFFAGLNMKISRAVIISSGIVVIGVSIYSVY